MPTWDKVEDFVSESYSWENQARKKYDRKVEEQITFDLISEKILSTSEKSIPIYEKTN